MLVPCTNDAEKRGCEINLFSFFIAILILIHYNKNGDKKEKVFAMFSFPAACCVFCQNREISRGLTSKDNASQESDAA